MASNMLEIGSVTCYTDIGSDRKSLVEDKGLTMYDMISNQVDFMVFNTQSPLFTSKEVRKGICYAINENQVLSEGYMDDGVLADMSLFFRISFAIQHESNVFPLPLVSEYMYKPYPDF